MLKVKRPRCIYNPLYMSSPGTLSTVPVVALALLWSTWTSTVDEALTLWFFCHAWIAVGFSD
jgi:hypothetical protein